MMRFEIHKLNPPFDNVEVVPVIILINDMFPFRAELLEHGIQHLRHLFLSWWAVGGGGGQQSDSERITQNALRVCF